MSDTADCKALLAQDPRLAGRGPWLRVHKRRAEDGVERVFTTQARDCFVRVLERDTGLSIDRIADSLADAQAPAPARVAKVRERRWTTNLAAKFPYVPDPGYGGSDADVGIRGFAYSIGEQEEDEDTLYFAFGYVCDDGALFDQHADQYNDALAYLFPEFEVSADVSEGMHEITIPKGHTKESLAALMEERFEATGVQLGDWA